MDKVEITFDIGDCKKLMHDNLEDDSIDACVTDPPYGLEFMGKEWDQLKMKGHWDGNRGCEDDKGVYGRLQGTVPRRYITDGFRRKRNDADVDRDDIFGRTTRTSPEYVAGNEMQKWHELWTEEVFRVLKPGAHILAFSGTRTFHRLGCAVEDVGFTIRDCLIWMYGQGFPKGTNISKSIDKHFGKKGNVIGYKDSGLDQGSVNIEFTNSRDDSGFIPVYEPATAEAKEWEGWFTGLKPAWEPIVMGRKTIGEKTLTLNVMKHGTGALNIKDCRIESLVSHAPKTRSGTGVAGNWKDDKGSLYHPSPDGRYPANVLLECICDEVIPGESADLEFKKRWLGGNVYGDGKGFSTDESSTMRTYNDTAPIHTNPECPCAVLDGKSGSGKSSPVGFENIGWKHSGNSKEEMTPLSYQKSFSDQGGASRYFYIAKASRGERDTGLKGKLPCVNCGKIDSDFHIIESKEPYKEDRKVACIRNNHPTVKPIELMRYLIRLITPPGGTVLDPFLGSGTTLMAARKEARSGIGYEKDTTMRPIIEGRLSSMTKSLWEFES